MKQKRYIKLFGWLAAATMLLTTSCKDELFTNGGGMSDEVTVSFTLTPEAAATVANRAVEYPGEGEYPHISDGSKADVLIYAVYDEEGNIIPGYGKGIVDKDGEKIEDSELATLFADHKLDENGQTIVDLKDEHFPYTFNMSFKRGSKYKIAFWAQSRKTKAYDTKDLCKVAVIYDEFEDENVKDGETTTPNNDEFRDAFCRSLEVDVKAQGSTGSLNQNVYLYRPLAQINVGTSGYDFETATRNAAKKYLYSKIRLNRVARYLDVVADSIYLSTITEDEDKIHSGGGTDETREQESYAVADFGYAPIPAYVNFPTQKNAKRIPDFPSYTVWDWRYDGNYKPDITAEIDSTLYVGEEFLKVRLDKMRGDDGTLKSEEGEPGDIDYDGFQDYANLNKYDERNTETFKYLSMCYVLTPSTKENSTTIDNVKVWMATKDDPADPDFDEIELLNINQVPVQRNWRTNIIGNLLTEKETIQVKLDKDFAGEYNIWSKDGEHWDTTGPLADGVYYDAAADEIQISNVNGLLWLQKMVNGNIIVRDNNGYKGNSYNGNVDLTTTAHNLQYNDENGNSHEFSYKPIDISELSDEVLKRIIKATHIDDNKALSQYKDASNPNKVGKNKDIDWPINNNFNFYNAKIKLMADIDLTGIKWIPIGWDFALHDTSIASNVDQNRNNNKNPSINTLDATFKQGKRRVFCGTFDGNGHTIRNLKTFRVGANVHETSQQTLKRGPYDNPQWYPYGLFGMIVDQAKIKNVRLQNVDIKGYDACGALVGIVFSGDTQHTQMSIENCSVDGGSVTVSPMYRGDSNDFTKAYVKGGNKDRTFARGVFCGGLVGDIVIAEPNNQEPEFSLTDCDVRNLTLKAYRQIGGLVGGIGNHETYVEHHIIGGNSGITGTYKDGNIDKGSDGSEWDWTKQKFDLNISGNTVSNVLMICNQFQAFNKLINTWEFDKDKNKKSIAGTLMWRNGFGWSSTYRSLAGEVVGGLCVIDDLSAYDAATQTKIQASNTSTTQLKNRYNSANSHNNVRMANLEVSRETGQPKRTANIGDVPLNEMPMLSSWFCDVINLNANYYGEPSAYAGVNETTKFAPKSSKPDSTFNVPFRLPNDLSPNYTTSKKKAGLYVESVKLDGKGNTVGNRSVITPEGVTEGCVIYVTARNRQPFVENITKNGSEEDITLKDENGKDVTLNPRQSTTINKVVLRGSPYAYTGLLVDPNENMDSLILTNIAIYDVYQTIAQANKNTGSYKPVLSVSNCNFRGYTIPGDSWQSITFEGTTFEQGTYINNIYDSSNFKQAYTYKAEADATFKGCYFKAPYVIDFGTSTLTFTNNCKATAQSTNNVTIAPPTGCKKIVISSKLNGDPEVKYYDANGTEL